MQAKNCYIFGAGEYEGTVFPNIKEGDLVIAADGGFTVLQQNGIIPNAVLGDFDSCTAIPKFPNVQIYPVEKDDTDMLLAVKYGLEKGCQSFYLYGGTGGRLDHTLANIQILAWLSQQQARGYLYGNGFTVTAVTDGTVKFLHPIPETGLSIFCYGQTAKGVTVTGCKYTVKDAAWNNQYPIGVSNRFTNTPAEITVKDGTLLIYWEGVQL